MSKRVEAGRRTAILPALGALAVAVSLALCAGASGCSSIAGKEGLHDEESTGGGAGAPAGGGHTGGSGAAAGGGESAGTGGAQCATPADCPGQDGPCQTVTCDSGVCGVAYAPSDTLATTQTTGDCRLAVCVGDGEVQLLPDDLDYPPDDDECLETYCKDGSPVWEYKKRYGPCGPDSKWICDGEGSCVECLADLDCGKSTACQARRCEDNGCVTEDTPWGIPCEGVKTCDGDGNCL